MPRSTIYEKLTAAPNDLAGVFAYISDKEHKLDYCKSFDGREPTREELESFYAIASLDSSLASYRVQGEMLAQYLLNTSLDEVIEHAERSTRQHVLFKHIDAVNAGLLSRLGAILEALRAKRSLVGWMRDVVGNLVVNLVSIFVLGALLLGYNFSAELQQGTEKKVSMERK